MRGGELAQPVLHLRHRVGLADVGAFGGEAAFEQVQVGVVEAGHDAAALRVDGDGGRAAQPARGRPMADLDDAIAADRQRLVQRRRAIGGVNRRVGHQQVGRRLGVALVQPDSVSSAATATMSPDLARRQRETMQGCEA